MILRKPELCNVRTYPSDDSVLYIDTEPFISFPPSLSSFDIEVVVLFLLWLLYGRAYINIDIGNRVVDLVPGAVCCEARLLILTFRNRYRRLQS